MAFLSLKLKVHNPSTRKRQLLNLCIDEYTAAARFLLEYAKDNIEIIRRDGLYVPKKGKPKYTDKSIAPLLPKPSELDTPLSSAVKEALVGNIAAMLASYLALDSGDKQQAGFPAIHDPEPDRYEELLIEFCQLFRFNTVDTYAKEFEQLENETRWALLRASRPKWMPIHFSRSRDFAILKDTEKDRWFVWLKLLPGGSDNYQPVQDGNLLDINKNEVFSYRGRSGLLLPIQIGRRGWQVDKFLAPIENGQGAVKAAKLTREKEDYYLHVSVSMETPEPYEPETWLGVNRGILHSAAWGIIDMDGNILHSEHADDPFFEFQQRARRRVQGRQKRAARISKRDYKRQELENILHRVANDIIAAAVKYRSEIILEDWKLKTGGAFFRAAYEKLSGFLEYKAPFSGVPVMRRKMWGAYISQLCVECGAPAWQGDNSRALHCQDCEHIEHVDEAAAINLARRTLYKKSDWGGSDDKPGDWRAFHRSFANARDFRAKKDLRLPVL